MLVVGVDEYEHGDLTCTDAWHCQDQLWIHDNPD